MKLLPETPTQAMIDAAVAFALNVTVSGQNGWSHYMRDLYETMAKAAPDAELTDKEALESYAAGLRRSKEWSVIDGIRAAIAAHEAKRVK